MTAATNTADNAKIRAAIDEICSARFTALDDVAETVASIADETSSDDQTKRWKTTACGSFLPAAIRRWHPMRKLRSRCAKCAD